MAPPPPPPSPPPASTDLALVNSLSQSALPQRARVPRCSSRLKSEHEQTQMQQNQPADVVDVCEENVVTAASISRKRRLPDGLQEERDDDDDDDDDDNNNKLFLFASPQSIAAFEYLDHPADVQLHTWGNTVEDMLASLGAAMVNYMVPLSTIEETETKHVEIAGAHDMHTFVFTFLDELLFLFHGDGFVAKRVGFARGASVVPPDATTTNGNSSAPWPTVRLAVRGERFEPTRHGGHGTEVKAITYSAMAIHDHGAETAATNRRWEAFVIVDI